MSLVFTFLCAISQVKALTLDDTSDFHNKLVEQKGIEFDGLDKAKKKDFIINNPEEDDG